MTDIVIFRFRSYENYHLKNKIYYENRKNYYLKSKICYENRKNYYLKSKNLILRVRPNATVKTNFSSCSYYYTL